MDMSEFHAKLNALFSPRAVAVIGASENPGKLGCHVMMSLTRSGYEGGIFPINPGAETIMGLPSYPTIFDTRAPIDLAIVVLPAKLVPNVIKDCAEKGVKGIVLITAGFKEIDDPAGGTLQAAIRELADSAGIPVIGPNTFGMVNLHKKLNASFTPEFSWVKKGGVSLVSQSGGISHLLAFTAMRSNAGFSKIVGLGNRLNVDFAEMVAFFMEDPDTKVIALYIEGIDDPRRLMDAVKVSEGKKPVVVFKSGSAQTGNRASLSHTGTLAGRHEIYRGAFRQSGLCCVDGSQSLIELSQALSVCTLPVGPRIAVLTGQAGPGMEACDACEARGLEIVTFTERTQNIINELLPPLALRSNPVDMGPAWYDAAAVQGIVKNVLEDENVDGLILLTVFASANRDVISHISKTLLAWRQKKPVLTCLPAPPGIWDDQINELESAGAIVNLPTPQRAANIMSLLWQYNQLKRNTWS
jgi:acyl-CoA synthetase (NDP forming)